jgi:imidazolonepropionase-like amidohydrolase
MRKFIYLTSLFLLIAISVGAQDTTPKNVVLFTNANVFDGQNEQLAKGMSVLIEGNKISQIAKSINVPQGAAVIDAKGKTLMPGLIDMHYHTVWAAMPLNEIMVAQDGYINFVAADNSKKLLQQGFTTVRDVAGNSFSIKRAIDEGLVEGPRIFPSGAIISQTSGHGDFRGPNETPENPGTPLDYFQRIGMTIVADGVPEVLQATRDNLRMGATQIKLAAGGGVASNFDPLDVAEYTYEELKAAVDAAESWNTYVMVHVYTPKAIQTAIRAGVKSIEHGQLLDEETAKIMAEKGTWLCLQPFLNDEEAIYFPPGSFQEEKWLAMTAGTEKAYGYAKKYGIKTAFGTDVLFDAGLAAKQGKQLAKLARWYKPFEVLKMATHDNAQLLKMCGPRDPYRGELGVVKAGAFADLILVDGNPLESIDLIVDPAKNFVLIMKDGKIYKNTIK